MGFSYMCEMNNLIQLDRIAVATMSSMQHNFKVESKFKNCLLAFIGWANIWCVDNYIDIAKYPYQEENAKPETKYRF